MHAISLPEIVLGAESLQGCRIREQARSLLHVGNGVCEDVPPTQTNSSLDATGLPSQDTAGPHISARKY